MKSRLLILLGIVTLATLSFTLVSIHTSVEKTAEVVPTATVNSEPAGGFVSEDRY